MASKILLEESSPLCPIEAYVEETNRAVHFYLMENPGSDSPTVRSCWVRNYAEAPASLSESIAEMRKGNAPLLPAECCTHPHGAERLDPARLSIVWFEEGNGAALLDGEEILCIIPGWAGTSQFPGFARDCTKPSPLALPLGTPEKNRLFERVRLARAFWASWDTNPWPEIQDRLAEAVTGALGSHSKYYAIDGGHWPPKALLRIERDDMTYLVTIGVSIPGQPKVEQATQTPERLRRFEFAMAIRTDQLRQNERGILSYISAQTNLPWANITWLGNGHTIPCDQIPGGRAEFPSILLLSTPAGAPTVNLGSYRGDPINLLWMVPITAAERDLAVAQGSEALLQRSAGSPLWIHDGVPKFTPMH